MTRSEPKSSRSPGPGLRFRLWIGCLAGSVAAATVVAVLLWRAPQTLPVTESELRWVWLPGILGGAVGLSLALAFWLDLGIVVHLRGVLRALASGQVSELRDLPASSGWGELSELTVQTQALLARQRQMARAGQELETLGERLLIVRDALEQWSRTGTWETLPTAPGAIGPMLGTLNREMARLSTARSAGREASAAFEGDLSASLEDVRDVAEQAERGFVEATALLTTVRELERLGAELGAALAAPQAASEARAVAARGAIEAYRSAAADAIGRLVIASSESVERLAESMQRVDEIADHTRLVANRATLIALHALTARDRGAGGAPAEDLETLARDVRQASDRVNALTTGIEAAAATARERMSGVRADVAAVLDAVPLPAPAEGVERAADPTRFMERVREMIGDAAAKGERLSAAGERASRAAERLRRRLESGARGFEQLAEALGGRGATPAGAPAAHLRVVPRGDSLEEPGDAGAESNQGAHATPALEARREKGERA
jgi:hypothetical protein